MSVISPSKIRGWPDDKLARELQSATIGAADGSPHARARLAIVQTEIARRGEESRVTQ